MVSLTMSLQRSVNLLLSIPYGPHVHIVEQRIMESTKRNNEGDMEIIAEEKQSPTNRI